MPEDLNVSIDRWRHALASYGSLTVAQLDELQDHLEAELKHVPTEGMRDEERVLLAARRVGAPDTLAQAFKAAHPGQVWRHRVLWMVAGWFILAWLPGSITMVSDLLLSWTADSWGLSFNASVLIPLLFNLLLWSAVFFGLWWLARGGIKDRSVKGLDWIQRWPKLSILIGFAGILAFEHLIYPVFSWIAQLPRTNQSYGDVSGWLVLSWDIYSLFVWVGLAVLVWYCQRPLAIRSR